MEELGRKEESLQRLTEALLEVSSSSKYPQRESPPLKVNACFVHEVKTGSSWRLDFDMLIT